MVATEKQAVCLVCRDKKNAESRLTSAERVARDLQRFVKTPAEKIEHDSLYESIFRCFTHLRFMCGRCPDFSENRYTEKETEVFTSVYILCKRAREGRITRMEKAGILGVLRGYYPTLYRIFEREAAGIR